MDVATDNRLLQGRQVRYLVDDIAQAKSCRGVVEDSLWQILYHFFCEGADAESFPPHCDPPVVARRILRAEYDGDQASFTHQSR